jgi:hypothetical protein
MCLYLSSVQLTGASHNVSRLLVDLVLEFVVAVRLQMKFVVYSGQIRYNVRLTLQFRLYCGEIVFTLLTGLPTLAHRPRQKR